MTVRKNVEFNELSKAQDILKNNGFSKGVLTIQELTILAKYYFFLGKTGNKLKKELIDFCKKNSIGFNEIVHRQTIIDAVKRAEKYNLKTSGSIIITTAEMDIIRSLPTKYGKILFIMIAMAKYDRNNLNKNKKNYNLDNNKYYCNKNMREIIGLARIIMTEDDILTMCKFLAVENQYIRPIEERDNAYIVFCINEDSNPEIIVKDMNHLINYLPFYCEKCGKCVERTGRRQKYCKECWEERERERRYL